MGYTPGNKIFLLWGHAHLLGSGWRRYWNHFKRSLKDAILGYQRASAYTLDKETCEDIAERLIQFKPFGVIGYAAALDAFLRLTPEYHAAFRNLGVQFVMPAAEAPPHEDTISMIEDVFGCTTIQEYAGVEFGQVAMKIGSDPFHVFPDLNVLETGADRSASGSAAFVTTLYDRYVPLIRYNTGDAIHGGEQTAQGHIHRFREIAGRSNDSFQMQDGKVIHSEALSHCIRQETDVHGIQIVKKGERIEVRLVAHTEHTKPIEQRVRRRLNQVHEQLGTATIVWAEDMTVNRAGKRRWLVEKAR
jgi:phenylacetate-coenzyme A ligase PaaK-like adenylate-forming protein